jgi:ribosomal protein S18 acetylase RimI-like enzyme
VLLAEEDGALQVCCELQEPATPGGAGHFGMFAVRPSLQSGGYGRIVLAEAERIARDEFGAATLEMTVIRQREALIAWYERRGYQRTGELKPFPYGDESVGRPKTRDLEFATLAKPLR